MGLFDGHKPVSTRVAAADSPEVPRVGISATHRIELLLFALLWVTYAYFYQSIGTNEAVRFEQIRAIVSDHTLTIDKYFFHSPDLIRYPPDTGRLYPNKAPGLTLIGAIPFTFASTALNPLRAAGMPEWVCWHLLTYLTTVFTVGLASALAAVAMYRALKRLTNDSYFAAVIVLVTWLGTLLFPYSTVFYSHVLAGSLLAIAFYLLVELRFNQPATVRGWFICAGCAGGLIGLSVAVEYPTALLGIVLSVYAMWILWRRQGSSKEKARVSGTFFLGLVMGGAVLASYNLAAFRNVFYIPYEAYTEPNSAFHETYAKGWMGLHWGGFSAFLNALASVTVYRPSGLLYLVVGRWHVYACNPVLWLTIPGIGIMIWHRELRAEGFVVAAMLILYLLFITNYGSSLFDWGGGLYLGARHLIPLLPFLAVPLYFGAEKLRWVFYPLAAVSVFYMLIATAVEPRVTFAFGDIDRDFLVPDYLSGDLAQNTASLFDFAQHNLTRDSTAANPAKLAHVPGRYQLAPLTLSWMMGGALLFWLLREKRGRFWSGAAVALVVFGSAIVLAPSIHYALTVPHSGTHGLLAKYYRNATWEGTPADIEIDPAIDFNWAAGTPYPSPFSVEWTGDLIIEREGFYLFTLFADDGAMLDVDGNSVIDASQSSPEEKNHTIALPKGRHSIRVRYFNRLENGSVTLWWTLLGRPRQIVPNKAFIPEMTRQPGKL